MQDCPSTTSLRRAFNVGRVTIGIEASSKVDRPEETRLELKILLANGRSGGSHVFPNIGSRDWRGFLAEADEPYIGDKLFGNSRKEPDFPATCKRIRAWVRSTRADGFMDVETAKCIRNQIASAEDAFIGDGDGREHEASHVRVLLMSLQREAGLDDVGGFAATRPTKNYKTFLAKVWRPFVAGLRAEIEQEKTAEAPELMPEF